MIWLLFVIFISIIIMTYYFLNNCVIYERFTQKNSSKISPKYKLCIMAIFKGEQDYMEEWLVHHINQGISHFYMYSNDEKMHNYPYLNKYMSYITLVPWQDKKNDKVDTVQKQAYNHCIQTYNHEYQYLMMLDIDEFIISLLPNNRVIDIIDSLDYDKTKAIKVQRYNFGSDGHEIKPPGNVMDNYLQHEKICSSYKTIANSEYIDTSQKFYGVHDFPLINKPGKIYNEYFTYEHTGFPNGCTQDDKNEIPLVINHYYSKSYEEYLSRCKLWENGGINGGDVRHNCEKLFHERNRNEVIGYDYLE